MWPAGIVFRLVHQTKSRQGMRSEINHQSKTSNKKDKVNLKCHFRDLWCLKSVPDQHHCQPSHWSVCDSIATMVDPNAPIDEKWIQ